MFHNFKYLSGTIFLDCAQKISIPIELNVFDFRQTMLRINESKNILFIFLLTTICKCDLLKQKTVQLNGIPTAYGDFDSDKFTDIFIIHSNRRSFEIKRSSDQDHYSFIKEDKLHCDVSNEEKIVALIPADFHGNAMMDVLVITKPNTQYKSRYFPDINFNLFLLYLVQGTRNHINCDNLTFKKPLIQSKIQPLLLDYNGDMIGDLLIQDKANNRIVLLFFEGNFTIFDFPGKDTIASPNSNAFIDLNNDFVPDIFIEGQEKFEYYYLKPFSENEQSKSLQISTYLFKPNFKVVGASTFFDLNSDGKIDHIIPVCDNLDCSKSSIVVWDESQISYITIASNFVNLTDQSKKLCFIQEYTDDELKFPIKLRQTDVDGDGYIDLIAVMINCDRSNAFNSAFVLKNVPDPKNSFKRSFVTYIEISGTNKYLKSKPEVILASFLDLGEDGTPDFILLSKQGNRYFINTIVNNQMIDACFFKVLVISGRCYDDCGKTIDNKIKNPFSNSNALGYGTNQAGQTIYFELIDSEGKQRKSCAGQLSQSADFALQMPYNIFGLGQLPNFIDLLTASLPINYTVHDGDSIDKSNQLRIQSWTQIVPDSQVVVIPHPPDQPSLWRTKLFITPSEYVLSTFITLIAICILLAIIIYFLWRKEVLEDMAEHKEYKKHWPESK